MKSVKLEEEEDEAEPTAFCRQQILKTKDFFGKPYKNPVQWERQETENLGKWVSWFLIKFYKNLCSKTIE